MMEKGAFAAGTGATHGLELALSKGTKKLE
jgi:hypothetical protein